MEELKAPEGYVKGLPSGISVAETGELQHVQMVDRTTKIEISKIHAPQDTKMPVLDMDHEHPETGEKPYEREVVTGDIASYTYSSVPGAKLALYPARRVYSADTEKYPKGYYLVKTQDTPLVWEDSNSTASNPVWNTAEWNSENEPAYFERIPAGDYLLEEIETPEGFVTADPVEITIGDQSEVEIVCMKNDTTKVEIEKFFTDEHGEKVQLSGRNLAFIRQWSMQKGKLFTMRMARRYMMPVFWHHLRAALLRIIRISAMHLKKRMRPMVWIFHYLAGRRMGRKNLQPSQLRR